MATATEQSEKVRENRLRAAAKRQGLKLHKSRQRDPRGLNYGRWMIVKPPCKIVRALVTLDEVEAYLTGGDE